VYKENKRMPDLSRRTTAATIAAIVIAVAGAPSAGHAAPGPRARPNVLVIVTDDQRAGTLRHMPVTRRLFARGGVNFRRAYATTPVCCPSRASIFTGRYAHNHRVLTNQAGQAEKLDQRTTIQYFLHRAGYITAMVGKYLNRWGLHRAPPYFDRYAVFHGGNRGYYGASFDVNGSLRTVPGYSTDFIARRSKRLLRTAERHDARPWFLYITPWAPHAPAIPEAAYRHRRFAPFRPNPAQRERDRSDKPDYVQENPINLARAAVFRRAQLRTLLSIDDLVGGVMRRVKHLGERRRTLAFFLSDNGVSWEDHGLSGKAVPYLPAVGIPMLMRWPGHVPARKKSGRLVANIDVAPTVLDAARVGGGPPMDGRSLLNRWKRGRLLLETFGSDARPDIKWAGTLGPGREYVEYFAGESASATFREYYDLTADPWQLHNLAAGARSGIGGVLDDLSRQLARDRRCEGANCP
jgi:arylsulfatase A-like enzyme